MFFASLFCQITTSQLTVLIYFRGTMLALLWPLVSFFKSCALQFFVLVLFVCMLEIKFNSILDNAQAFSNYSELKVIFVSVGSDISNISAHVCNT